MTESILNSTKEALGIVEANTDFDGQIKFHLNSVLSLLKQVGVGPDDGLYVEDDTATWNDFIGDNPDLNMVRSYVYAKVRLMYDTPTNSFLVESLTKIANEFEWRLNVAREATEWIDPNAA